mmetsp:Transcript_351/g.639  ORF Transcript_351/g.639 Transcript_351/m.639 type:complete len:1157 (+) Transcript_351:133-3603(+)
MWKVFKKTKKKKKEEVVEQNDTSKRDILNKYKNENANPNNRRGSIQLKGNIETIAIDSTTSKIQVMNKEEIMRDPKYSKFPDTFDSKTALEAMLTNEEFVGLLYKLADDPNEMDDLASSIYHISSAMHLDLKLMKCLLREEFASCSRTKSQVLRLNSLATKTVKYFIENKCRTYLKNLLHDPLLDFQQQGDSVSFQLNPLKIQHNNDEELKQSLETNTANFKKYSQMFLDAILSKEGRNTMPIHFLILASDIVSLSFQYDFNKRAILSGFFILRFINPGIVEAEKLRIIEERLTPKQIRELIQLVRVIQNASGKIHFGKAQTFMAPMNDIVQQYDVNFQQYYASLLLDTDKYKQEFNKYIEEGVEMQFNFQDETLLKSISIVRSFLYKYREKLTSGLNVEAPLFHYFLKTGKGLQIEKSSVELEQRKKIDFLVNQLKDISRDNYTAFSKFKRFNKLQKVEKQNESIVAKISKDRVTEYENRLASLQATLKETKEKLKQTQEDLAFYTKPTKGSGDTQNFQVLKSTFDRMRAQYEAKIRDINVDWYSQINSIQQEHTAEVEKERKETKAQFELEMKDIKEEISTITQKYENRIAAMKRHENLVDFEEHQRFVQTLNEQNEKLEAKTKENLELKDQLTLLKDELEVLKQNPVVIEKQIVVESTPVVEPTIEEPVEVEKEEPAPENTLKEDTQEELKDKLVQSKLMGQYEELKERERLLNLKLIKFKKEEMEAMAEYREREQMFDKKHQEQISMIEALEAQAEAKFKELDERSMIVEEKEKHIRIINDLDLEFNRLNNEKKSLHLKAKEVREGLSKLEKREKVVMRGELELEQRTTELLHREASNKKLYEQQKENMAARELSIKTMLTDVEVSRKALKEQQMEYQKSKKLFDLRYQRLLDDEKDLNASRNELNLKEKQLKIEQSEASQRKLQLSLAEQNLSFQMRESHLREEQLERERAEMLSQSQKHYEDEESKISEYKNEFEQLKTRAHGLKISMVGLESEKNKLEREIGRLYAIREQYKSPTAKSPRKTTPRSRRKDLKINVDPTSPIKSRKSPLFKKSPLIGADSHLDQLNGSHQPKLIQRDMESHIIASCEKKIAEMLTESQTTESREKIAHLQSVIREMNRVRQSKSKSDSLFYSPTSIQPQNLDEQLAGYFS